MISSVEQQRREQPNFPWKGSLWPGSSFRKGSLVFSPDMSEMMVGPRDNPVLKIVKPRVAHMSSWGLLLDRHLIHPLLVPTGLHTYLSPKKINLEAKIYDIPIRINDNGKPPMEGVVHLKGTQNVAFEPLSFSCYRGVWKFDWLICFQLLEMCLFFCP